MKKRAIEWLSAHITNETTKAELDLIEFIRQCVKNAKERESVPKNESAVDIDKYFNVLWTIYPKKTGKEQAKKTFEHKLRGLTKEQCDVKCNAIYKAEKQYIEYLQANDTPMQYIKMFSSWLNSEVPNSKYYKGSKK